jgi:hypothetical protein
MENWNTIANYDPPLMTKDFAAYHPVLALPK